jgi:hypothetical protein
MIAFLARVNISAISGELVASPGSPLTRASKKIYGRTQLQKRIQEEGPFVLYIFWIRNCGNHHIQYMGRVDLRCLAFHKYFAAQ